MTDSTRSRPSRLLRYAVVILAVGQPASIPVFNLFAIAPLASGADESPVVPPGPMFSIWSLIIVASLIWAVLQARRSTFDDPARDALASPLIVAFAAFTIWLAAASLGQTNGLTLVAFVLLIVPLVVAMRRALEYRQVIATWPTFERGVLWTMLGTYLGWTSVAFFINVANVVQATGAPISSTWGTIWQTLVLLAAAGVAVVIVRWTRGLPSYAITAVYAFVGAGISTTVFGFEVLAWICGVAVVAVVTTALVSRRRPSPSLRLAVADSR